MRARLALMAALLVGCSVGPAAAGLRTTDAAGDPLLWRVAEIDFKWGVWIGSGGGSWDDDDDDGHHHHHYYKKHKHIPPGWRKWDDDDDDGWGRKHRHRHGDDDDDD